MTCEACRDTKRIPIIEIATGEVVSHTICWVCDRGMNPADIKPIEIGYGILEAEEIE